MAMAVQLLLFAVAIVMFQLCDVRNAVKYQQIMLKFNMHCVFEWELFERQE